MRYRLLIPILITLLFLAIGLISRDATPLLICLPPLMLLALGAIESALNDEIQPDDFIATRTTSHDRLLSGEIVEITISLNYTGSTICHCRISDNLPENMHVIHGKSTEFAMLKKGDNVELLYKLQPSRSLLNLDLLNLTIYYAGGLKEKKIQISAPRNIYVLPTKNRLTELKIKPVKTRPFPGLLVSRLGGEGIDFHGLREYQPGDSKKHISWRASARQSDKLLTKVFRRDQIADIGIILDARSICDHKIVDNSGKRQRIFNESVDAVAGISEQLLSQGNRVGLLQFGGSLKWTFPGTGAIQQERILRALAESETGNSQIFDNFTNLPVRFFPANSQIILISPLIQQDSEALKALIYRGYQVLVISPNPISFEARLLPEKTETRILRRLLDLQREQTLRDIRHLGIRVADWDTATSLNNVLRHLPPAGSFYRIRKQA
jgi:uncharacterized protein (DUF58 family)